MDRCRTPVFTVARVRKAERDCEAQKPSPFGPRNDGELPRRHLRASEIEHPRDPAIPQGMYLIRIGHVNTADPLEPYSTRAFPASGRRCSTFCPGGAGHARRAPPRHPRSGTVLRFAPERMSVVLEECARNAECAHERARAGAVAD